MSDPQKQSALWDSASYLVRKEFFWQVWKILRRGCSMSSYGIRTGV